MTIRADTTDPQVVWYVLRQQAHLPPAALGRDLRSILDVGANIGVAAAHFATLYPAARILAVEPDPENAALCRANVAPWAERCEVVEGAAWTSRKRLRLTGAGADAFRVEAGGRGVQVDAIPMCELVERAAVGGCVDYVKMNVEGAERELLAAGNTWAGRVRCLRVEIHPPYDVIHYAADLRALGFSVTVPENPARNPWVTAIR